jgi:uncharacterized protein involved in exopolysaccharide biosynthesis/Mrp family chromosome partitioning ATPase
MSELLMDSQPPPMFGVKDIIFALLKHKWKIVFGGVLGLIAAAIVHSTYTPVYESHAKLLVRYVLERTPIDPENANTGKSADNIIGSEVEILTSWDLAMQVVDALGVPRLLPNSPGASKSDAAGTITSGLRVTAGRNSNIIFVSYTNADPEIARLVLDELVNRYFTKHLEVHRSVGAFDFVTQQTDQVRSRLNETEDALKALKAKAGITSYAESTAALGAALRKAEDDLYNAEEELAGQRERVKAMTEASAATAESKEAAARIATAKDVQRYQALTTRINQLRQHELDLLSKYTPSSPAVKLNQEQIDTLEKQKDALEERFPDLARAADAAGGAPMTLASEKGRLVEMQARVNNIKARLANLREGMRRLSDVGTQIAELERNQELEIANYKYFKGTLEKARIDEALDPSKMPNISAVQRPSPPARVYGKRDKTVKMLAAGGFGLAIALVLLKELFLNQTVKRADELEARLGTRLLVSVPYSGRNGRSRLPWKKPGRALAVVGGKERAEIPPWEPTHFIRPYAAAIRDRLGLYFELNQVTHKPKLVGVTGFRAGAGISTLAAGVAAALSEVGDGKVLLVDVNLGPGEVHPFFNGRPALPLTAALSANGSLPSAAENLYLATVGPSAPGVAQLGLKKFFDLMPNLQASDFDYVIFDMPPIGQTSPSLGIAGFMDKVLLVVEAEKTNREVVKRGYEALRASRDNVSVVINKTRTYVPKWLEGEN